MVVLAVRSSCVRKMCKPRIWAHSHTNTKKHGFPADRAGVAQTCAFTHVEGINLPPRTIIDRVTHFELAVTNISDFTANSCITVRRQTRERGSLQIGVFTTKQIQQVQMGK
jgi:hypothetical protein